MGAFRRAYVYSVALVSLGVMGASVHDVLAWVAHATLELSDRGDVPLFSVAGVIVQVPIWVIHWAIAQRSVAHHPDDRAASIRRLYLIVAIAGAVVVTAVAFATALRAAIIEQPSDALDGLAAMVTAVPILLVHRRALVQDCAVLESPTGAVIRRAYLAIVAGIAAVVALASATELIAMIVEDLIGFSSDIDAPRVPTVADAVAALASASLAWATHHRGEIFAVRDATPVDGDDPERRSFLPALYRVSILTISVAVSFGNAVTLLDWAASRVFGPSGSPDVAVGAGASLLMYAPAWWAFRRSISRDLGDASASATVWVATLERTYRYVVTVIALAVAATGVARLLGLLFDTLTGSSPDTGSDLVAVRFWVAATVIGLPTWIAFWRPPGHPRLDTLEIASRPRRGALYVVVFACAVSLLTAGVWVAYGLLGVALGKPFDFPLIAMSATAVATTIGAYHLSVLRAESRLISAVAPARGRSVGSDAPDTAAPWAAIRATSRGTVVTWHTTVAEAQAVANEGEARWHAVAHLNDVATPTPADASTS
jgi:hypothetical protein